MKRLDLDDLPPKLAALLTGLEDGEELILVRNGVVMGRLTGGAGVAAAPVEPEPPLTPDEQAREIFEQFRSSIEDEF